MIEGFEKQTNELTDIEIDAIPLVVAGLKYRVGKDNAITNSTMVDKLKYFDYKISDVGVRKIIHHIRVRGLVSNLVATSKGYHVEDDNEKVTAYVESLGQRIRSIQEVKDSFEVAA